MGQLKFECHYVEMNCQLFNGKIHDEYGSHILAGGPLRQRRVRRAGDHVLEKVPQVVVGVLCTNA